jgi:hypothetical protein
LLTPQAEVRANFLVLSGRNLHALIINVSLKNKSE